MAAKKTTTKGTTKKATTKKTTAEEKQTKKTRNRNENGQRLTRTRVRVAGEVFKKFGRDKGITEEMIKEVSKLYDEKGKENDAVSFGALCHAEDALAGWFGDVKE